MAALTPGRYITLTGRSYRVVAAANGNGGPDGKDLLAYPANGRVAVARVRYGALRWASHPRVEADVAELLAAPAAAAARYAARTGRCARCGREISGGGPYGPECANKEA